MTRYKCESECKLISTVTGETICEGKHWELCDVITDVLKPEDYDDLKDLFDIVYADTGRRASYVLYWD